MEAIGRICDYELVAFVNTLFVILVFCLAYRMVVKELEKQ